VFPSAVVSIRSLVSISPRTRKLLLDLLLPKVGSELTHETAANKRPSTLTILDACSTCSIVGKESVRHLKFEKITVPDTSTPPEPWRLQMPMTSHTSL
jgi:hypothetical protein